MHATRDDLPDDAIAMVVIVTTTPASTPDSSSRRTPSDAGAPRTAAEELNTLQDAFMARESVEGRPPSHQQRRFGWRVLPLGLAVLVLGCGTWALWHSIALATMLGAAAGFLLVLVLMGWPLLATGRSRAQEESSALRRAIKFQVREQSANVPASEAFRTQRRSGRP